MLGTGTFFQDSDEGVPDTSLLLLAAARLREHAKEVAEEQQYIRGKPKLRPRTPPTPLTPARGGEDAAVALARVRATSDARQRWRRRHRRGAPVSEAELLDLLDTPSEARFRPAPAEASGDGFARATAKVKAFLTKHIGSELRQLEHPTGRNPFTREILGQTPADRVAKLAAGEVPNAAPWREQVAEWLRLLEL